MEANKAKSVLRITEAAELLCISTGLAYDLARRGELPGCSRIGRKRFLVSRAALEKAIELR